MVELDNKQKVIIGIIAICIIGVIVFYFYSQFTKEQYEFLDEEIEETNEIEEDKIKEEAEDTIIVHIAGAVQNEGIVEIKEGARISDVIEKAGGLREDASLKNINLAYIVEDGQKIYIPTKQEDEDVDIEQNTTGEVNQQSQKININTASKEKLQELSGIGEATAQKIINYREENGKFQTIEDIKNVSGIGTSKFNQFKDEICVK